MCMSQDVDDLAIADVSDNSDDEDQDSENAQTSCDVSFTDDLDEPEFTVKRLSSDDFDFFDQDDVDDMVIIEDYWDGKCYEGRIKTGKKFPKINEVRKIKSVEIQNEKQKIVDFDDDMFFKSEMSTDFWDAVDSP